MLGERSLTRRTRAVGSHVGGTYVPGAASTSTITGTFRPMPETEVQLLDEGFRHRDPRVLYTRTRLLVTSQHTGQLGDQVSLDGSIWYDVHHEYDGDIGAPGMSADVRHWRYACLRVQEADG